MAADIVIIGMGLMTGFQKPFDPEVDGLLVY